MVIKSAEIEVDRENDFDSRISTPLDISIDPTILIDSETTDDVADNVTPILESCTTNVCNTEQTNVTAVNEDTQEAIAYDGPALRTRSHTRATLPPPVAGADTEVWLRADVSTGTSAGPTITLDQKATPIIFTPRNGKYI